ncbi:hypothetical protein [Faecalibacterium prausnitzii]|uniref:hypothetical protein n=1 Tax=Faecalibacterium prausnitzii TaxID=853 RepID=UPI001FB0610C|nr:hypothetical protein [Faecalibacterium prausnitzii]
MHIALDCIQFAEDFLSDDPLNLPRSRHLSFARDAPELHRQQLCMEQRLQCMDKDVLMYLLFRRFLAKVPFLHFDPINAFELPDWFQVKAFVPDLLCFPFGHCVNGINDLPALVVLSFMKQLRFRDFSGLC